MSTTALALIELDSKLRSMLDEEKAPVMGPCLESIRSLHPELLKDPKVLAITKLLGSGADSVQGVVSCLRQWPTITVLIITEKISQAYGEENEFAVHSAIAELLGQKEDKPLNNSERKRVWREFRRACYKLGLTVSSRETGVGYMVEEFLHQAGLPLSFVARVTLLMLKTASLVGLPDEDDPTEIARWQEYLLEQMKHLPPTPRRSIEADRTGFYIRTFLRVFNSPSTVPGLSVAGITATVVQKSRDSGVDSPRAHNPLRIPQLLWRNDELLVELPPSDEDWVIIVDGDRRVFRSSAGPEDVPVLSTLPTTVEIMQGRFTRSHTLWEDRADNRFLIFDSDGRLMRGSALGQPIVTISPGEYTLVLRFEADDMRGSAHLAHADPDLYVASITLLPGEKLTIRRGPAETGIEADFRPWMSFVGKSIRTLGGEPVWQMEGSFVEIALRNSAELEDLQSRRYVVRLSTGGIDIGEVLPANGRVSLQMAAANLQPGVYRIVLELCPEGTQRPVARTSGLLWKGLHRQDGAGRLWCSDWPVNFLDIGCENTVLDRSNKVIGPRDIAKSNFQLEFQASRNRSITLTLAVPGIFMQVDDYSSEPVEHFPTLIGTTLAAQSTSRQILRIRSTTDGQLLLQGNFLKAIGANRPLSLHVSSLAEMLETGSGNLEFSSAVTHTRLLQLTAPHQIHGLSIVRTPHQYKHHFRFVSRCTEVRLHAENMLTEEFLDLTVSCDNPADWADITKARLESERSQSGLFGYCLTFQCQNWAPGAWLVSPEVRLAGRWGFPTNARQDHVAFGLLIVADGTTSPTLTPLRSHLAKISDRHTELCRFLRVHRALQRCYTIECWQQISWLKELWKAWLYSLSSEDQANSADLIRSCAIQPPAESPKSWLPLQRIEATFPTLFALPSVEYRGLEASGGVLADTFRIVAALDRPLRNFPANLMNTYLACGFGIRKMTDGERPKEFDFNEYSSALLSSPVQLSSTTSWQPSLGDYLGRDHYQVAWERLRSRYRETLSGNEIRRKFAIPLCIQVRRDAPAASILLQARGRSREPESVEGRFIDAIEVFVSSLASACRVDVRQPNTLSAYRVSSPKNFLLTLAQ